MILHLNYDDFYNYHYLFYCSLFDIADPDIEDYGDTHSPRSRPTISSSFKAPRISPHLPLHHNPPLPIHTGGLVHNHGQAPHLLPPSMSDHVLSQHSPQLNNIGGSADNRRQAPDLLPQAKSDHLPPQPFESNMWRSQIPLNRQAPHLIPQVRGGAVASRQQVYPANANVASGSSSHTSLPQSAGHRRINSEYSICFSSSDDYDAPLP